MKKIPKHFRWFLIFVLWLVVVDLLTKHLFFDQKIWYSYWFIEPVFNLGVSWSMQVPILVSICIGRISLMLFIIIYHKKYISWWVAALLVAGTIGNLVDRLMLWGVRDFILVWNWFPVFNIADILLNIWIIAYFRKEFFTWKRKLKK